MSNRFHKTHKKDLKVDSISVPSNSEDSWEYMKLDRDGFPVMKYWH
jgi:hypothetical protein